MNNTSSSLITWGPMALLLCCGCAGGDKFFSESGDPNASKPSESGGSTAEGGVDSSGSTGGAGASNAPQNSALGGATGESGAPPHELESAGASAGAGAGGASGSGGSSEGGAGQAGSFAASGGMPAAAGQGSNSVAPCSAACCGTARSATAVADSVKGFSATQGSCGWSYGYLLAGALPFVRLTIYNTLLFDTPAWVTSDKQPPWTATLATILHPNGDPAQWNDRRWTSTVAGTVSIQGHVAKSDPTGGDGITAHLRVAGVELWSTPIAFADLVGKDFTLTAPVKVGTPIDFLVEAGVNDKHDTTTLTAVITL